MAEVHFSTALNRFFPDLKTVNVEAATAAVCVSEVDKLFPGFSAYITDEVGRLRKHVNIFINNDMIKDRKSLSDEIKEGDSVHIIQALSGG